MRSTDAFKGAYLKSADILHKRLAVVIDEVRIEEVGQGADKEEKPVLYFKGKDKGLVLNQTNWARIADYLRSDESDDWRGQSVIIGTERVDFQGKRVDAIRVLGVPKGVKAPPPKPPEPEPTEEDAEFQASDDDVPF